MDKTRKPLVYQYTNKESYPIDSDLSTLLTQLLARCQTVTLEGEKTVGYWRISLAQMSLVLTNMFRRNVPKANYFRSSIVICDGNV